MTTSEIRLPGFRLPLNYAPITERASSKDRLFPTALNRNGGFAALSLTTLREFTMLHLMNQLTDKPDWHKKVFDEEIVAKWKLEAFSATGRDITEAMVTWCIEELRYKANVFLKTGAVTVYNGDVVKSDVVVPVSLKEEFKNAAAPLEAPTQHQDWHPGSDGKVLDLVHPSLFPLVYGKTRILPDKVTTLDDFVTTSGEGIILGVPSEEEAVNESKHSGRSPKNPYSRKFQWLPCDVDISDGRPKIVSYINNLHPKGNESLYGAIEKIVSHTIPLWDLSLTPLKTSLYRFRRIQYDACEFDRNYDDIPLSEGPQREDGEDDYYYEERRTDWWESIRQVILPEPGPFSPPTVPGRVKDDYLLKGTHELKPEHRVDLLRDYRERGLQIIVKLANIHLTPEKPVYEGGTWHVEGQLNEHICASAIYYYDSHNITTSRLAFRQQSDNPAAYGGIEYEQNVHDWLPAVFGCEQDGPRVQDIGTVDTPEGRLLTWPNVLQHKVQPFTLIDPSKPGHRKILALFLVDPHIRVISTANVPCQRRDWWSEAVQQGGSMVSTLPLELQREVFDGVDDFPIGLEEAKELRLELMEERKAHRVQQTMAFEEPVFSLCEH